MRHAKKDNPWRFGMTARIALDADSRLVHTVTTTAANESDVEQIADLLHGKEQHVWCADPGCRGAPSRVRREQLQWHIAARPGDMATLPDAQREVAAPKRRRRTASVRANVEAPVATLFALSNLWMARRRVMAMAAGRPRCA